MEASGSQRQHGRRPLIEWIAGGIGLVLTCGLVGFIGWQAMQDHSERPQVEVRVTSITPSGDNYLVELTAFSRTGRTVSGLDVEGVLTIAGQAPEMSTTSFDYLPGHSQSRGGLYFTANPATGDLQVRAPGFQDH